MQDALRQHYLFAGLDNGQYRRLRDCARLRDLAADAVLFSQNDAATAFFLLTRGAIKLYRLSAEGQEKIMRLIQPEQSFAESVMFMEQPRYPVHARTTRASQVLAIPAHAYLEVMESSFATCRSVFESMTRRIQTHWDEIEALSLQNSRYRVVHYLLGLTRHDEQGAVAVTLPARKAQIAAHLALTPETLSRVLRSLQQGGLIDMQGYQVRIPDVGALGGLLE